MRRILQSNPPIPNTINGETKAKLKERSIVNPDEVVFDLHDESWTRDGREDLPVSSAIVGSIILAHDTDNRSDKSEDAAFTSKSGTVKGNPVIWGSLSATQITIMGTNEKPVLVISAAGRQTAKASEWTTNFLTRCRKALCEAHARLSKEKEEASANAGSLLKRLTQAKEVDKAALQQRLEEWEKKLAYFGGKDVYFLAVKQARSVMQTEPDSVTTDLLDVHYRIIFEGSRSSKLGKPLVGLTYSAVVWLSVSYTTDLPSERRSLEKSKLANLQVPSLPSTEADAIRRLIRDYVINNDMTEEQAIDHVRQYARPLMAVGAPQAATPQYVWQLYRLSMLCLEARQMIDNERDPRKMLANFDKLTKRLFTATVETIVVGEHEVVLTTNELSEEDQHALLHPPKPTARSSKPHKTASTFDPALLTRLGAMRSPMAKLTEQQREQARAVWAWEAHRSGEKDALKDYPHLAAALSGETEASDGEIETPLSMALAAVDYWSGKGAVELPDFAEKMPKDDEKLKAWRARADAHDAIVKEADKLIKDALKLLPSNIKSDARAAWLREKLEEQSK